MKKLSFILITLIFLSCTKNDNPVIEDTPSEIPSELIGKWKIIEVYSSVGGEPEEWRVDTTGFEYDIDYRDDETFIIPSVIEPCQEGLYSVENEIIYLTRDCGTGESSWEYEIELLTNDTLIVITPHFELVKNKYVKVCL